MPHFLESFKRFVGDMVYEVTNQWTVFLNSLSSFLDVGSRGYERAKSSSSFTSFSFASSARNAARYLVRAFPSATGSFPAPQVNSVWPNFTAATSAIMRAWRPFPFGNGWIFDTS